MEKRPFAELGLSPEILRAVDKMGFEEASPIQTAVIPLLLQGKDVVGQSSTGSGKTAAFAIPAIERIDPAVRKVQALILCPTRELAVQVAEEFGKLAYFKRGLNAVPIYGGQSYERQFRALEQGAQIVIGTPGRVMDHMERGTIRLDGLKIAVLDEADRMLDMGFRDDIHHILQQAPAERQLLFFSATMPSAIRELIQTHTRNPEWVKIEAHALTSPQVDQMYFEIDRRSKVEVLTRLIDLHDFRYGIIFCSTKVMVDDLDEHLHSRGYSVDRLHGDISQMQRDRVMAKFRQRGFEFLIATDVAARGLDVDDLEVVFNYDLPNDAEDYTHRIGRTGRAGRTGTAFTFVCGREIYKLQMMMRQARLKIRREYAPSIDQVEEARENIFFERLRGLLEKGDFTRQDRLIDRLLEQGYSSTDIASALVHMIQGDPHSPAPSTPAPQRFSAPAQTQSQAPAPRPAAPVREAREVREEREPQAPVAAPAPKTVAAAPTPKQAAPVVQAPAVAPVEAPAPVVKPQPKAKPAEPAPAQAEAPAAPVVEAQAVVEAADVSAKKLQNKAKKHADKIKRTGEVGYTTVKLNVGHEHKVSAGEIVGKISGVTRLPANVIGAIEISEHESLVDVLNEDAPLVLAKLLGVRMKGIPLKPAAV